MDDEYDLTQVNGPLRRDGQEAEDEFTREREAKDGENGWELVELVWSKAALGDRNEDRLRAFLRRRRGSSDQKTQEE